MTFTISLFNILLLSIDGYRAILTAQCEFVGKQGFQFHVKDTDLKKTKWMFQTSVRMFTVYR